MVAVTKILLLATSAAALTVRTVQQINDGLKTIDTNTKDLTSKANAYNGGTNGLIPIVNAVDTLNNSIVSTTQQTNGTPGPVTDAQATTILNYVSNPLTPDIKAALNAIVAKKSQFTSAGVKSVVQNDLVSLRQQSGKLAAALIAKAPSGKKASASSASKTIDSLFASATAAYA